MARACIDGVPDSALAGALVFVRADLNVPLARDGTVLDAERVRRAAATVDYLTARRARVVLATHVGRPKGPDPALSTAVLVPELERALAVGTPVATVGDCVGDRVDAAVAALAPGSVLLLENVRFHPEETKNDAAFAKRLAGAATLFVGDAFGASHRAHASNEGLARVMRGRGYPSVAGLLLRAELAALGRSLCCPARPLVAIVGGSKPSTKAAIIARLSEHADAVALVGGLATTFVAADGGAVGAGEVEAAALPAAAATLASARARGTRILLPVDVVAAGADGAPPLTVGACAVPAGLAPRDAGPATIAALTALVASAGTVVWNGPLGVFETPPFDAGTRALALALAPLAAAGATTIVGGGHSVAAVNAAGVAAAVVAAVDTRPPRSCSPVERPRRRAHGLFDPLAARRPPPPICPPHHRRRVAPRRAVRLDRGRPRGGRAWCPWCACAA
jgi:phosphoglycerate kinase